MNKIVKDILWYGIFAGVCVIINIIYVQFSHEVSSNYMTYMFLYPSIIGIITSIMNYYQYKIAKDLFMCGILTLTLGSFLQGIFEIAGTASDFQIVFYVAGICLILCGLISLAIYMIKK